MQRRIWERRNGNFFMLRTGSHRNAVVQAEWNAHGEESFQFEVLETLGDDVVSMALRDVMKEKKRNWMEQLNAPALLP